VDLAVAHREGAFAAAVTANKSCQNLKKLARNSQHSNKNSQNFKKALATADTANKSCQNF
jgi:hypothetical protein